MNMPEISAFDWLVTCPASDPNYRAALQRATVEQLAHAILFLKDRPGNKTRVKACRTGMKRRGNTNK